MNDMALADTGTHKTNIDNILDIILHGTLLHVMSLQNLFRLCSNN